MRHSDWLNAPTKINLSTTTDRTEITKKKDSIRSVSFGRVNFMKKIEVSINSYGFDWLPMRTQCHCPRPICDNLANGTTLYKSTRTPTHEPSDTCMCLPLSYGISVKAINVWMREWCATSCTGIVAVMSPGITTKLNSALLPATRVCVCFHSLRWKVINITPDICVFSFHISPSTKRRNMFRAEM